MGPHIRVILLRKDEIARPAFKLVFAVVGQLMLVAGTAGLTGCHQSLGLKIALPPFVDRENRKFSLPWEARNDIAAGDVPFLPNALSKFQSRHLSQKNRIRVTHLPFKRL